MTVGDLIASLRPARFTDATSMAAAGAHVDDPAYTRWLPVIGQSHGRHRKVWEWCFILQALERHGVLAAGRSAIGFGVGTEPLAAVLAARGVRVVATDQPADRAGNWATSNQHAAGRESLRRSDLCADEQFDALVEFAPVDMTSLPADLGPFDAAWSSCCFEHLGSADAGFDFVVSSIDMVRVGGVAVHTTEFDCSARSTRLEVGAIEGGDYVCFYRRSDLARLVKRLRALGHDVRANYYVGTRHPLEREVDEPPYSHDPHLRLRVADRVVTSFGLTVVRGR
ncbi:MAG TPA: class I SAM-dependent methyltransferase [Ilumatobacteraceae bacterium]